MNQQDDERFTRIFNTYCHALFRYINRELGGDRETAKDILCDVWEVLLQKFDTIAYNEPALQSWLFSTARNKVKNYQRKRSTYSEIPHTQQELLLLAGQMPFEDAAERMAVEEYIRTLRPIEQRLLLMRLYGCSYRELSASFHRSEQALQCLYSRTLKKLQLMMACESGCL